jgi:hypothetical protein
MRVIKITLTVMLAIAGIVGAFMFYDGLYHGTTAHARNSEFALGAFIPTLALIVHRALFWVIDKAGGAKNAASMY